VPVLRGSGATTGILSVVFSEAFTACVIYAEFPYVIRRRNPESAAEERLRISSELREVQSDIAYYRVWLRAESVSVADRYDDLVAATRQIAGREMHEAWNEKAVATDSEMNMPDLGLGELEQYRENYVSTASRDLAPAMGWIQGTWARGSAI
jgi:hypothetical protein